jgi:hypothetical protein
MNRPSPYSYTQTELQTILDTSSLDTNGLPEFIDEIETIDEEISDEEIAAATPSYPLALGSEFNLRLSNVLCTSHYSMRVKEIPKKDDKFLKTIKAGKKT